MQGEGTDENILEQSIHCIEEGEDKLYEQYTLWNIYLNIISKINSRETSGINTILHELNPLFNINTTKRDIKSNTVYSSDKSKATTQWRKTESANGVHLAGVASDYRSS